MLLKDTGKQEIDFNLPWSILVNHSVEQRWLRLLYYSDVNAVEWKCLKPDWHSNNKLLVQCYMLVHLIVFISLSRALDIGDRIDIGL